MNENLQADEEEQAATNVPPIESMEELSCIIQAIIFAATDVVTLKKLKEIIGDFLDQAQVSSAIRYANEQLAKIKAPFEIVGVAGGYRFRTKNAYYLYIRKLFPDSNTRRLSIPALETLAVVAYKQPITKAGIEAIRGVSCDAPINSLLNKKLIALDRRTNDIGNHFTYATTIEFLKYFGINRIDDLPHLTEAEFSGILNSELIPQYSMQNPPPTHPSTEQLEIPLE
jgi:segregation and condensation protein B